MIQRRNGSRIDPLDVGLCNCCKCDGELIGERCYSKLRLIPRHEWPETAVGLRKVWARLGDRPFCHECYKKLQNGTL
jgi:hypothetical protein